jgi:hypothetical protein
MPWVGFEPTIPAFERAKTVHALDSAATVIGTTSALDAGKWPAPHSPSFTRMERCTSHLPSRCYLLCQANPPWPYHPNNILGEEHKQWTSSVLLLLLCLRSNCSSQLCIIEHLQSVLFPLFSFWSYKRDETERPVPGTQIRLFDQPLSMDRYAALLDW